MNVWASLCWASYRFSLVCGIQKTSELWTIQKAGDADPGERRIFLVQRMSRNINDNNGVATGQRLAFSPISNTKSFFSWLKKELPFIKKEALRKAMAYEKWKQNNHKANPFGSRRIASKRKSQSLLFCRTNLWM